jgi:hypothetical protein
MPKADSEDYRLEAKKQYETNILDQNLHHMPENPIHFYSGLERRLLKK